MKKFAKRAMFWFVIVFGGFALWGSLMSNEYAVEKVIIIDAPRSEIHSLVSNLEYWDKWSPWKLGDPNMIIKIGKISKGVGANQSWEGQSGKGSLLFTKSNPNIGIEYDLYFNKRRTKCFSSIRYHENEPGKTQVVWFLKGKINIPIFGSFIANNMPELIEPLFEKGLKNLQQEVKYRLKSQVNLKQLQNQKLK